jgi:hypothetical protein
MGDCDGVGGAAAVGGLRFAFPVVFAVFEFFVGHLFGVLLLLELFEKALSFEDFFGVFVGGDEVAGVVGEDFGDGVGGVSGGVADVGGGDLEGVDDAGGALEVDAVLAEGGEDHGEGELDGVGVFEGGELELDGAAGFGVVLGEDGFALELFGAEVHGVDHVVGAVVGWVEGAEVGVDALVVVAEGVAGKGTHLAAAAAGTDVTAVDG